MRYVWIGGQRYDCSGLISVVWQNATAGSSLQPSEGTSEPLVFIDPDLTAWEEPDRDV